MKRFLAAAAIALLPVAAQADRWPDHGFFYVEQATALDQPTCRLRLELSVDHKPFAFILDVNRNGALMVQFMTGDHAISEAKRVIVRIDGKEVLRFKPGSRSAQQDDELPSVVDVLPSSEGREALRQLRDAASNGGQWFQVVAAPYSKAVPADGLSQALSDLDACRLWRNI